MKRRIATGTLLLASALALSGCGGSSSAGSSSSGTGSDAPTAGSTTSSSVNASAGSTETSPSAAESTPASASPSSSAAKTYTNEALAAIVSGLKDAKGQALTVVPAAQVNQGLIKARKLLTSAVIKPAACNVLADNNSQVPEGSTYAAGSTQSAAENTATVITVFAVKDASAMTALTQKSEAALAKCPTFTISMGGQTITAHMKAVAAKTSGDKSLGSLASESARGQTSETLTVTGVKGNLAATAVKTGAKVTVAMAPELIKLVDAVLAKG